MLVLRAILPLFALCLLPACVAGTADTRVSGDYAALVEQVGVISLLHPHPHVNLLGSSALESRFRSAQVPGWTIDRLAQAQIKARLERRGLQARSIARDGAFATAYAADWRAPAADTSIAAAAYAAGAAAGLDVVVVVQAALVPDFVTDTHQRYAVTAATRARRYRPPVCGGECGIFDVAPLCRPGAQPARAPRRLRSCGVTSSQPRRT